LNPSKKLGKLCHLSYLRLEESCYPLAADRVTECKEYAHYGDKGMINKVNKRIWHGHL